MAGVEGKVAFLTGAASGIGRTTAQVLAQGGADVVVTDINQAGAEETAQSVADYGRKALALPVDVTVLDAVEHAVIQAQQALGSVDILFSNAGSGTQAAFTERTEHQWDENVQRSSQWHLSLFFVRSCPVCSRADGAVSLAPLPWVRLPVAAVCRIIVLPKLASLASPSLWPVSWPEPGLR